VSTLRKVKVQNLQPALRLSGEQMTPEDGEKAREIINEQMDLMIYGNHYKWRGKRIDPRNVKVLLNNGTIVGFRVTELGFPACDLRVDEVVHVKVKK
jgi:hypothetical protein